MRGREVRDTAAAEATTRNRFSEPVLERGSTSGARTLSCRGTTTRDMRRLVRVALARGGEVAVRRRCSTEGGDGSPLRRSRGIRRDESSSLPGSLRSAPTRTRPFRRARTAGLRRWPGARRASRAIAGPTSAFRQAAVRRPVHFPSLQLSRCSSPAFPSIAPRSGRLGTEEELEDAVRGASRRREGVASLRTGGGSG